MTTRVLAIVLALTGLAAVACVDVPVVARAEQVEGTFERTLQVTGPVSLDVLAGSGSIVVRSGIDGRVVVEGRIRAGERSVFTRTAVGPEERVRRLADDPPIQQNGNEIRIGRIEDRDLRENVSISYTVTVPADATVVSRTGSGSQEIEGIRGLVNVSAGSGSIRVRDAGSSVRASTGSGSITADRVGGSFEARAGSGSIEGMDVNGAVTVETGSGGIRVSQTGTGDVDASAGSGSIELTGVRGGVRASTGSGSLTVRGEQTSEWRLSTSSGSVTVELDGNPAFDLDASGGRIDTAFPVSVTGRMSRRELRGAVNGGGPLLRVQTSSGRISLR